MGDIVHVLPAMRAIRSTFPDATLGWVVEDSFAEVIRGLPEIDRLFVLPRSRIRGSWMAWWKVGREARPRLREVQWDWAVDFQGLWKSLAVCAWSGANRTLGYAPSPEWTHLFYTDRVPLPTMNRHAVDRHLDLVAAMGASVHHADHRGGAPRDFALPLGPAHRVAADQLWDQLKIPTGTPAILVNFSARKPANQWGVDRFCELVKLLDSKGMTPILTGGPADMDQAREIESRVGTPVRSLVGKCSLLELTALMKRMDAIVTGDTGPMHLAVSAGLPVVALFGPANPVRTGPYSANAVVLQEPRACQPCYARNCKFGTHPPPCLLDLSVERVAAAVESKLVDSWIRP